MAIILIGFVCFLLILSFKKRVKYLILILIKKHTFLAKAAVAALASKAAAAASTKQNSYNNNNNNIMTKNKMKVSLRKITYNPMNVIINSHVYIYI